MIREEKNIDKLFHNYLHNYEEDVPEYVWENINEKLKPANKPRYIYLIQGIAASVALLLAFGAGYLYNNYKVNNAAVAVYDDAVTEPVAEEIVMQDEIASTANPVFAKNDLITEKDNNVIETPQKVNEDSKTVIAESTDITEDKESLINELSDKQIVALADIDKIYLDRVTATKPSSNLVLNNQENVLDDKIIEFNQYTDSYENYIDDEKLAKNDWILGSQVAPVYAFVRNDASVVTNSQDINHNKGKLAFSGGVDIGYQISERFQVYSGLFYSESGQMIDNMEFTESNDAFFLSTNAGNIETSYEEGIVVNAIRASSNQSKPNDDPNQVKDQTIMSDLKQNFEYIEIPAFVKYNVLDKKIGFNLIGGVSTGILVGNTVSVMIDREEKLIPEARTENINAFTLNGNFGVGLFYKITPKLTLSLDPIFKRSLTSINSDMDAYQSTFSMFTGLHYAF